MKMFSKDIRVVLVGVEGSINLGFVARLCKNFGINRLYLVNPSASINEEALRFAVKGSDVLQNAVIIDSLDKIISDVDVMACTSSVIPLDKDPIRQALELKEFVEKIENYKSVAIVFGRESTGLTREELEKCHMYVHINAFKEYPVLNLSHAVAIVLYELFNKYGVERSIDLVEKPDKKDFEVMERILLKVVSKTFPKERVNEVYTSLRRIIYKSQPTLTELRLLTRTLSKLVNRLETLSKRCEERSGEALD